MPFNDEQFLLSQIQSGWIQRNPYGQYDLHLVCLRSGLDLRRLDDLLIRVRTIAMDSSSNAGELYQVMFDRVLIDGNQWSASIELLPGTPDDPELDGEELPYLSAPHYIDLNLGNETKTIVNVLSPEIAQLRRASASTD